MSPTVLSHTLYLLLELFHDFNSQDLPEAFEDNIAVLMGLLHKYLVSPPGYVAASADVEDEDETEAERIRGAICEIIQLYCQKYTEEFTMLDTFVSSLWSMLTSLSSSKRFDGVRRLRHFRTGNGLMMCNSSLARLSIYWRLLSECLAKRVCLKIKPHSRLFVSE